MSGWWNFDNFSPECFRFCSSACWCDNINQHFCGNSAFGDEHCNQDEETLMNIAKIKESKFSKITFTGKMYFDPYLPLSISSMLAWQSQAMLTVGGGGTSVGALAKLFLTPHIFPVVLSSVCQWCPSYAVIWPGTCSKQLWLPEGRQSRNRKPGSCLCWKNWQLPTACCSAPHSRPCCLLKSFGFSPWCCQHRTVHRCTRAPCDIVPSVG